MAVRQTLPVFAAACLALLTACVPTSETPFYSLVPPATEAGRQCLAETCAAAAEVCRRDCGGWSTFCRDDARNAALSDFSARSRVEALTRNPERLTRPEVSLAQCDSRERGCQESCQTKYRSCFAGCGGQVTRTRM